VNIDIGKAFTRMLTPSQRQIDALERLAPIATSIVGAATGTAALTNVGAAFAGGNVASNLQMLQGGDTLSFQPIGGGFSSQGQNGTQTVLLIGAVALVAVVLLSR
jgi:hypothetical protein